MLLLQTWACDPNWSKSCQVENIYYLVWLKTLSLSLPLSLSPTSVPPNLSVSISYTHTYTAVKMTFHLTSPIPRKNWKTKPIPTLPTESFAAVTLKENFNLGQDQSPMPFSSPCPMTTPILLWLRSLPNFAVLPDVHQLYKAFILYLSHFFHWHYPAVPTKCIKDSIQQYSKEGAGGSCPPSCWSEEGILSFYPWHCLQSMMPDDDKNQVDLVSLVIVLNSL